MRDPINLETGTLGNLLTHEKIDFYYRYNILRGRH